MGQVTRFAGQPMVLSYVTSIEPTAPPTLNIYSDEARTQLVQGPLDAVVVRPVEFNFQVAALTEDTYFLQFITQANGQTYYDENDSLLVITTTGEVSVEIPPITRLRRMTGEYGNEFYSDEEMQAYLTAYTDDGDISYSHAALAIWVEKIARYASMVDMVESGAERKLSQLYKNATGMVSLYNKFIADEEQAADELVATLRVAGRSAEVWGGVPNKDRVLYEGLGPRLWGAA